MAAIAPIAAIANPNGSNPSDAAAALSTSFIFETIPATFSPSDATEATPDSTAPSPLATAAAELSASEAAASLSACACSASDVLVANVAFAFCATLAAVAC